jgi:hypothetical protein
MHGTGVKIKVLTSQYLTVQALSQPGPFMSAYGPRHFENKSDN